jgi:hypothetical protein
MNELPKPAIFVVDGCVIDLAEVAAVFCHEPHAADPVCTVLLRGGTSFRINMGYSRSLIQAVVWSRSPGSVAGPGPGSPASVEAVDLTKNPWAN